MPPTRPRRALAARLRNSFFYGMFWRSSVLLGELDAVPDTTPTSEGTNESVDAITFLYTPVRGEVGGAEVNPGLWGYPSFSVPKGCRVEDNASTAGTAGARTLRWKSGTVKKYRCVIIRRVIGNYAAFVTCFRS